MSKKKNERFEVSLTGKPRRMKANIFIPIYGATLWIIVTDDIPKEHKKWEHLFGKGPEDGNYYALASYSGGDTFALFFRRDPITLSIITHEVFHLTHRIMEWASVHFDAEHHEQGALLNAYLMELVCKELAKG
jgi:hypothetical protein